MGLLLRLRGMGRISWRMFPQSLDILCAPLGARSARLKSAPLLVPHSANTVSRE